MADNIKVEVAFALPNEQALISLEVEADSTVADVIRQSGLDAKFPGENIDTLPVGIWGHVAERSGKVKDGDRVEIYRPLLLDPRDARRELARSGRTMSGSAED